MDTHLKPIETQYKGYRMRSRLEARWACFFDALGVPWEYEKEGFDLDGLWYLPDFWLPDADCWVEIKGAPPSLDDLDKMSGLCRKARKRVYMFSQIPDGPEALVFIPWGPDYPAPLEHLLPWFDPEASSIATTPAYAVEHGDPHLALDEALIEIVVGDTVRSVLCATRNGGYVSFHKEGFAVANPVTWYGCTCQERPFPMGVIDWHLSCGCGKGAADDPRLIDAVTAARSARFEHGEKGRRRR